jgi:hypothetical protein
MYGNRKQAGLTMWGLTIVIALIVFFTLLTLKLLPPYLENAKVHTALKSLSRQPGIGVAPPEELMAMLQKRFDVDDIDRVDLRKALKIEAKNKVKTITVSYETRVPLAYNISVLLEFSNSVEVKQVE